LSQNIAIPSSADYMKVVNYTAAGRADANVPVEFFWQYGMISKDGIAIQRNGAANAINETTIIASQGGGNPILGGFVLVPSGETAPLVGPPVAFTAISNATSPVVSTASTAGLSVGSVVRLSQSASLPPDDQPVLGIDFQISAITPNVSFTLQGPLQQAPGGAGTAGFWRQVNISSIFYPQTRYVINITQAVNAVVTTSVNHGYLPGQIVRFNLVSSLYGMTQINQMTATITAVTANTFTTNLNTTGFSPFTWSTVAAGANPWTPNTPPSVDLLGQDTAFSLANNLNTLSDAELNTTFVAMQLNGGNAVAHGIAGPAGSAGDTMFWVAGKCYNGN
jgi:hypothetical protein